MKNIFSERALFTTNRGIRWRVVQDRAPSVGDAEAIFVVDFMDDAWFGRVRILIDMTAVVWTPVCAWINGRWPSRRPATGRALPAIASGSAEA
jgi:hypothetical protein